jgi:hypothetical protein
MPKALTMFIMFTMLTLYGCALILHHDYHAPFPTAPSPLSSEVSAIGIVITEQKMESVLYPSVVFFAKVAETEDIFSQNDLIISNFTLHGHYFLLNIPPGRYVAVASGRARGGREQLAELTFFTKEMIRQTETIVAAGEMKSMGSYEISYPLFGSVLHNQNDSAQRHYYQILQPDTSIGMWSSFWRFFQLHQRELSATNWKADRSVKDERLFLDLADVYLNNGQSESWSPFIQHRREALVNGQ